ncbi:hypothetical protein M433DRAFT_66560 [Acidomyces richmondensis BFW]|nr:MAG: hypothetical protein FE78DRAFT_155216 [Acidomyces sp. 'richmondensis']KYG45780.1 hypothetical protein M433DRAFT_66560 [Acidomyces richmondensis BFW]
MFETSSQEDLESHCSGRLSPVKQLQLLEDDDHAPVYFRDFGDPESEIDDRACQMQGTLQRLADGIGIINDVGDWLRDPSFATLRVLDQRRLSRLTSDPLRSNYGGVPHLTEVMQLVDAAISLSRNAYATEDDWNTLVQHPLLNLALRTSVHNRAVILESVKSASINPAYRRPNLPRRIIDYVYAIKPNDTLRSAFSRLPPPKSWNHICKVRREAIALNIETKAPTKSWTDGRPQIAIWVWALIERLRLLGSPTKIDGGVVFDPPPMPVLIAQGHEWNVLIIERRATETLVWQQIPIGSTRNVYDVCRALSAIHWLIDWAERDWRDWLTEWVRRCK